MKFFNNPYVNFRIRKTLILNSFFSHTDVLFVDPCLTDDINAQKLSGRSHGNFCHRDLLKELFH